MAIVTRAGIFGAATQKGEALIEPSVAIYTEVLLSALFDSIMDVWRGGEIFQRSTRLCFSLWEQSVAADMGCGIGSLTIDGMASARLQGGILWQRAKTPCRWRHGGRVDVPCPVGGRHTVKHELERHLNDWSGRQFPLRHADKRRPHRLR